MHEGMPKHGQLAGEGLLASLVNYTLTRSVLPIPVFHFRGTCISMGLVYASSTYMEAFQRGRTHGGPATVHLFKPRDCRSDHGYDFMRADEREKALHMIMNTLAMVDRPREELASLPLPIVDIAQREWDLCKN